MMSGCDKRFSSGLVSPNMEERKGQRAPFPFKPGVSAQRECYGNC